MSLKAPDFVQKAILETYVPLSTDVREALKKALRDTPPALTSKQLANHIFEIVERTGIKKVDVNRVIRMLTSMYSAKEAFEIPTKDFVEELFDLLNKSIGELIKGKKEISQLKKDLISMLSAKRALGITSKANEVLQEHQHVFREARILTDIRPIFGGEPGGKPEAAVLVHTLKILYSHDDFTKEFFVALDTEDVGTLQKILSRAKQKENSLKTFLKNSKLHYIPIGQI